MTGETPTFRRAARVLLLDEEHRVLLVRLTYHGKSWWDAPGGGLEDDETHEDAARRKVTILGYQVTQICWSCEGDVHTALLLFKPG